MAGVIFQNPNDPVQPHKGVYRWFYREGNEEVWLYVGNAGARDAKEKGWSKPSTLSRGVGEVHRSSFSSDKGCSLDTDFIVGTALEYLTEVMGLDCVWEHIENNPKLEREFCEEHNPKLQDGKARIKKELKMRGPENRWRNSEWQKAKGELYLKLAPLISQSA
jgi:hypothetical protein